MANSFYIFVVVTMMYGFIYSLMPGSFGFESMLDPYYFSFTTMSTVGYGDFSPKTTFSKLLVMSQQTILIGEIVQVMANILEKRMTARFPVMSNKIL
jgi:hypothetical protein